MRKKDYAKTVDREDKNSIAAGEVIFFGDAKMTGENVPPQQ